MKYKTIPVDPETGDKIAALCQAYELGQRGQGALVRKLVNAEYEKLAAVKLVAEVRHHRRRSTDRIIEE